MIGFQKMSLINILGRKAILAKPCKEREKRIQKGVGKTLGKRSIAEADREMKARMIRQGRERKRLAREIQLTPHSMELKTESAKLSSLCLQCPH